MAIYWAHAVNMTQSKIFIFTVLSTAFNVTELEDLTRGIALVGKDLEFQYDDS